MRSNNKKDGSFTFGEITYSKAGTYVYKLIESNLYVSGYTYDKSVYTVTVFVTDNSRGLLSAKVELEKNGLPSTEIVFRNGFTPTPISYNIEADFGGEKVLDGRPMEADEFEFVLINAINIGRYYNPAGPQQTLYIPAPLLHEGENEIIVFESDGFNEPVVEFVDAPELG